MAAYVTYVFLLLAVYCSTSSAIKCYQCRSLTEPACATDLPTTVPDNNHWAHKYIVDCDVNPNITHLELSVKPNAKSTFCRKQYQEIEGEVRIIRSCGFVKGDRACYSTANPPTKTFVCQCDNVDLCNSALNVFISPVLLVVGMFAAIRLI